MIRKRAIVSVLSLTLVIGFASQSQAAQLLKGKCPKAGATTTENKAALICVKSGRNLIWALDPTKKAVTDDEKLEAISKTVSESMAKVVVESNIQIHTDPLLKNSSWNKDVQSGIQSAEKLLTVLGVVPQPNADLYISWGTNFLAPYLPASCIGTSMGGSCGSGRLFADLKYPADNWGYGGVEKNYRSEMDKFIITANIPHEIGHLAQEAFRNTSGNEGNGEYQPPWLREGGAEYFKFLTYSFDKKVSYKHLHDLYLASGAARCKNSPIPPSSNSASTNDGCEYTKGLFAVEYLVLKTGKPDAFLLFSKTNGTSTEDIFKKAYGISLADFAKEADTYFSNLFSKSK